MAASAWGSNAALIADCRRLGYLTDDGSVLDPTYGRGRWWTEWRPAQLTTHDLRADGVDFRDLPHPDGTFAHVAYDPPYVAPGGRATTTVPDLHDRYGLATTPRTPSELQVVINDGLVECVRVLAPGGTLLVKCQDYIWSHKLWLGTHHTLQQALEVGLECVDRLEFIAPPRPQPPGRRQLHARRNVSTLLVLRKPRR